MNELNDKARESSKPLPKFFEVSKIVVLAYGKAGISYSLKRGGKLHCQFTTGNILWK
jgi:hypothetical protein